nr:hypothetical protein CFP56_60375 [Quercus suber]
MVLLLLVEAIIQVLREVVTFTSESVCVGDALGAAELWKNIHTGHRQTQASSTSLTAHAASLLNNVPQLEEQWMNLTWPRPCLLRKPFLRLKAMVEKEGDLRNPTKPRFLAFHNTYDTIQAIELYIARLVFSFPNLKVSCCGVVAVFNHPVLMTDGLADFSRLQRFHDAAESRASK